MADLISPENCLGELGVQLRKDFERLISASRATSTWSVYATGWKSLQNFVTDVDIKLQWPVDIETVRSYVVWCISKKNLKANTVKLYLSAIKMGHTIQGLSPVDYHKDKIIDMLHSGAANVEPTPEIHAEL
jgi:Phage integrase SAM-like domain